MRAKQVRTAQDILQILHQRNPWCRIHHAVYPRRLPPSAASQAIKTSPLSSDEPARQGFVLLSFGKATRTQILQTLEEVLLLRH